MTDLNRAIEFIEKSERLALALPEKPSFDCLVASEVILGYLENRGKQVGLLTRPESGGVSPKKFSRLPSLAPLLREFVVSFDSSMAPVMQLRYEKEENRINIIFSPKSAPLKEEQVSFRQGKAFCDAIIAIGIEDIGLLNNLFDAEPELLINTPVLNLDNSKGNKNYGELNLVNPACSLSESVYKLITLADAQTPNPDMATLLIAGILNHNAGFSLDPSPDSLLSASELMRIGGNWQEAQELWRSYAPMDLLQLFGRASVRSKLTEDKSILWSFLTSEDFEKTKRAPSDTPSVLDFIKRSFPPHKITSLLWQGPQEKTIGALLVGERGLLDALASKTPGEFKSPHFSLDKKFSSFGEAEEYVTSLLEEIM